jgi:plasmid stabilization system protein ParE
VTEIVWAPQAVSRLENHPRSGRIVPELTDPSIREIVVRDYRVVYRLREGFAEVLTVFHVRGRFPSNRGGTRSAIPRNEP